MKVWLTLPYADDGVEEIETSSDPTADRIVYNNGRTAMSARWAIEGRTWHRTKDAAIAAACQFRAERIEKAKREVSRLEQLPPI